MSSIHGLYVPELYALNTHTMRLCFFVLFFFHFFPHAQVEVEVGVGVEGEGEEEEGAEGEGGGIPASSGARCGL